MSDMESAASDAAPEAIAPVSTPAPAAAPERGEPAPAARVPAEPSASNTDAIKRAFDQVSGAQPRDEQGKFAPKSGEPVQIGGDARPAEKPVDANQAKLDPPQPAKVEAPPAPAADAPARFSPEAKVAWAQAPEPVKAEVNRALAELTTGLEGYQAKLAPLRQFDEMAQAGGTTLPEALGKYVNMENMLRADPARGMVEVCRNLGVDPRQMAEALAGFDPSTARPVQTGPSPDVARLEQQVSELKRSIEEKQVIATLDAFATKAPRFNELADAMAEMLNTGYAKTLEDAYDKATRLHPPPADPAPKATIPVPAPQTRKEPVQISGSPSGSNPASRHPAGSAREALERAFGQVRL